MHGETERREAISTYAIAMILIVVIVLGTAAYIQYAPTSTSSPSISQASSLSQSQEATTVANSLILNGTTSAGLYNGLVSFKYTQAPTCTPALSNYATNQTEAAAAASKTGCEVGGGQSSAVSGAIPVFILVPAYAGLSIFGVSALGATSQGFPMFDGQLVFTQCGAGGTISACADHPALLYSPVFTEVEQHVGIKTGYGGLPEGVLPTPAHTHVVGYSGGPSLPWDVIAVLVFDPNIMPNAQTGECHQVVDSNLTNPTGNCLNSFAAMTQAMGTRTTATANANATQNNPIYDTLGGPSTQIVIPGVTSVSENSPANTNIFLYFSVAPSDPYP